ncbi:MAG: Uma2 family endonuclease [Armatimonadaceae bacterium]
MPTEEPQVFLHYKGQDDTFSVPFPPFYLRDDAAFYDFCQDNGRDSLRFERDSDGRVRLMPPSGTETGRIQALILMRLAQWNEAQEQPGYVFDASAGFRLPNGAIRAPDISYVRTERYDALSEHEREHYAPLAPDFVIEVMSPSDRLRDLQGKMEEYAAHGVSLGWLIDRRNRTVYIYHAGQEPLREVEPSSLSAEPELPNFELSLDRVF